MPSGKAFPGQAVFTEDTLVSMNVATLQEPGQLGAVIQKGTTVIQLVKAVSTPLQRGDTVMWQEMSAFAVKRGGRHTQFAGIALASVDSAKYGFIQVAGPMASARSNSAIASAGSFAVAKVSANGVLSMSAAATVATDGEPIGVTLGATTSSAAGVKSSTSVKIVPLWIHARKNGW